MDWSDYEGREQSGVKHLVLKSYLERLAYKIGYYGSTLNYIDGFAGPWKQATDDLRDTSPFIAISELRRARQGLTEHKRQLDVRCLFIEKDRAAHAELCKAVASVDNLEVETLLGQFEDHLDTVARFGRAGRRPFSFIFIDPTGWTGYGLKAITPLLQQERCEVLINFMTKDIKRFVDDETSEARDTFVDLFGSEDCLRQWKGLEGLDREDAIVQTYCEQVRRAGHFEFVCTAVVLHPTDDRSHFHLIYATRHPKGLRTFRKVEEKAMEEQEGAHNIARQHRRLDRLGQSELFGPDVLGSRYLAELRERYRSQALHAVETALSSSGSESYDRLVCLALAFPMTSEKVLKGWLKEWMAAGRVRLTGLSPRVRVPKHGQGHGVVVLDI